MTPTLHMTNDDPNKPQMRESAKRVPMRTCSGCREAAPQSKVMRVGAFEGRLAPDLGRRLPGRGAWVHPNFECLTAACRGGFARSLKQKVSADAQGLADLFLHQLRARVDGLLLASHRTRRLAVGRDAVNEAIAQDRAYVVMVSVDMARANDVLSPARNKNLPTLRFGEKEHLGALLSREHVATLAVLDTELGTAVADAVGFAASMDTSHMITSDNNQLPTQDKGSRSNVHEPSPADAEGGPVS